MAGRLHCQFGGSAQTASLSVSLCLQGGAGMEAPSVRTDFRLAEKSFRLDRLLGKAGPLPGSQPPVQFP